MKACAEHLNELRETAGEDVGELPPETVDSLFESLVVPNAKKRTYPIGNLEVLNCCFFLTVSFSYCLIGVFFLTILVSFMYGCILL